MELYALHYWSYSLCLLITAAVFLLAVVRPPSQEQKLVLVITFFIFVIMFGYWGSVNGKIVSPDLLIFVTKIEYVGTCNIFAVLTLLLVRLFNIKMPRRLLRAQVALSLLLTLVAVTFDKHRLFFSSYHVELLHNESVLVKSYGAFHTVYIALLVLYAAFFAAVMVRIMAKGSRHDKTMAAYLFIPVLLLSLSLVLERLGDMRRFSAVPFALMLSSISIFFLLTLAHFGDIPDIAKEVVYDSIDDALVTVDSSLHLLQYNKKAAALFPFLAGMSIGDHISGRNGDFESVFSPVFGRTDAFPVDYRESGEIYQPLIRPVFAKDSGRQQASILWLKNVTDERSYSKKLERDVTVQTNRILDMQNQMIIGFAKLVENRDMVTGKHLERTRSYVLVIGMMLLKNGQYADLIDYRWVDTLSKVAPLHDVGKVSIPDGILNKPARLTPDEFDMMKKHTVYGARILETTLKNCVDDEYYRMAMEVARSHHERWDGKGYPDGLSGEQIPLSARVMAVADVFDALVTQRPYKPPFPLEQAFKMIEEDSGSHFDPVVVRAFLDTKDTVTKIAEELKDDADELDELQSI